MHSLTDQQNNFIDTINDGPGALNPNLFIGPVDRVLLGLKAHANTINHARLVALEETFPRTRNTIGDEQFNKISRAFCDSNIARACDPNQIGAGFIDFLDGQIKDRSIGDLARIEWAWLQSYHAPEADAIELVSLGSISETKMLELPISRHPAARIVNLNAALSPELSELTVSENITAILIARPQAEVRLTPLDQLTTTLFVMTEKDTNMSNLLMAAIELRREAAPLEPILTLIGAGALVTKG